MFGLCDYCVILRGSSVSFSALESHDLFILSGSQAETAVGVDSSASGC